MRFAVPSLPLALAYLAYPLSMLGGFLLSGPAAQAAWPPRNWIDPAWCALGAAGLMALAAGRRAEGRAGGPRFPLRTGAGLACAVALLLVLRFGSTFALGALGPLTPLGGPAGTPWLMEAKPLLYLLAAGLWSLAFGLPAPSAFRRYGLGLAGLLVLDFGLESWAAGEVVRPFGSGEVNYDACLLLVALAAAAAAPKSRRAWPLAEAGLVLGLLATMSRTGLAAGALILLFLPLLQTRQARRNRLRPGPRDRGRAWLRWAVLGPACLAGLWLTTLVRPVTLDEVQSMDRYWMWLQGLELFAVHPAALLTGFPPGLPLPADAPDALAGLWTMQAEAWDLDGVHPFNFHAFWLRAALTWGVLPPAGLALALLLRVRRLARAAPQDAAVGAPGLPIGTQTAAAARAGSPQGPEPLRPGSFLAGLAVVLGVMGLTMGLFYPSNLGVPLVLALAAAWQGASIDSANR